MTYDFVITYETGEREVGTTVAFSLDEAVRNIISIEDIDEVESVVFNYTMRHSASFDNEDLTRLFTK